MIRGSRCSRHALRNCGAQMRWRWLMLWALGVLGQFLGLQRQRFFMTWARAVSYWYFHTIGIGPNRT